MFADCAGVWWVCKELQEAIRHQLESLALTRACVYACVRGPSRLLYAPKEERFQRRVAFLGGATASTSGQSSAGHTDAGGTSMWGPSACVRSPTGAAGGFRCEMRFRGKASYMRCNDAYEHAFHADECVRAQACTHTRHRNRRSSIARSIEHSAMHYMH